MPLQLKAKRNPTQKEKMLAGDEASGDKSRTFVFHDEGHTLGNSLKCIISRNPNVEFVGYTVPHPAENKMNFRIQASKGKAVDILKQGLEDLEKVCDHIIETFTGKVNVHKSNSQIHT